MTLEDMIKAIQDNTEWLETTQWDDEVECISLENLEGILSQFLNQKIKLTNGN
jgi:hypothetical protein